MATLGEYAATLSTEADQPETILVSGNEASDADSIVTALLYAYLLQQDGQKAIPVVKCRREDMQLRSETVLLLQLCGVDSKKLVFLDDPGTDALLKAAAKIVLVDHNAADGPLIPFGEKVVEIIDHHKDILGQHAHVQGDSRCIAFSGEAATAASCCSVICEKYLAHSRGKELLALDSGSAARALLGVILIDSINLDPKAKKVCDRDIAAASVLKEFAPKPSQEELFKALDEAKFSQTFWNSLHPAQCLRYDFKSFRASGKSVGLSSVLCPLSMLVSKSGWTEEAQKYINEYDLYGVLVFSKNADGSTLRQLALMSKHEAMATGAAEFLTLYESNLLQLKAIDGYETMPAPPGMLAFDQGNVSASRKQVAPGCIAFLESLA